MSATLQQYHQQIMINNNQQTQYHPASYSYPATGQYNQPTNYYNPAGLPGNANTATQRYQQQQPQSQPQQPQPQSQPLGSSQDQSYYPAPYAAGYIPAGGSYSIQQDNVGYGGQIKYSNMVYPPSSYSEAYSVHPASQQHQLYSMPYGDNSQVRQQSIISDDLNQQKNDLQKKNDADKNRLIKLARRKRNSRPKIGGFTKQGTAKLLNTRQGRPLSPRTKIKLTLAPNLCLLYSLLVADSAQHGLRILKRGKLDEYDEGEKSVLFQNTDTKRSEFLHSSALPTQVVVYTQPEGNNDDSAEADLSEPFQEKSYSAAKYASKSQIHKLSKKGAPETLFSSAVKMEGVVPVYDDIDTSVKEIFGIKEFSLLRITRAAALEPEGAIVLKIETAKPGDQHLNDDEFDIYVPPTEAVAIENKPDSPYSLKKEENKVDGFDESADAENEDGDQSGSESGKYDSVLGKPGDPISCTFLKKKVARPRYKANMRIYVLPKDLDVVLYAQEKMLKRDLMNGTLNLDTDKRLILCAFDYKKILDDFDKGNITLSSASILSVGEQNQTQTHHVSRSIDGLTSGLTGNLSSSMGAYTTGPLLPGIPPTPSQSIIYQTQSGYSQPVSGTNQQHIHYYTPTQSYQTQYSYYTTQSDQSQSQPQQQQMMYPNYSLYGSAPASGGVYQMPHQQQ